MLKRVETSCDLMPIQAQGQEFYFSFAIY